MQWERKIFIHLLECIIALSCIKGTGEEKSDGSLILQSQSSASYHTKFALAMVVGAKYPWRNSGETWCRERNWEKATWLASGISIDK
jgi:hypothetical protein